MYIHPSTSSYRLRACLSASAADESGSFIVVGIDQSDGTYAGDFPYSKWEVHLLFKNRLCVYSISDKPTRSFSVNINVEHVFE